MHEEYHNYLSYPPFLTNTTALAVNRTLTKCNPFFKVIGINFEAYRGILNSVLVKYRKDKKRKGAKSGRPAFDVVFMLMVCFAGLIVGVSDLQLYGMMENDFRLREFLGFPKRVPKPQTIWNWRNIFAKYKAFEMLFQYDVERVKALFPHVGRRW